VGLATNRAPRAVLAAARPGSADQVEPLFHLRRRLAEPHLPQGSPTSPALANLCAFSLDLRLASLARTIGATYSRYADDLTFSGDGTLAAAAPRLLRLLAAIADDEGFALNPRKTRIMRARVQQRVTGIVVNRHPNVPRPDYDTLKATLTNCLRHGPSTQTRGTPRFRDHLRGRIAWVAQVHPARGQRLLELFHRIDWTA
jgi:RNA-directed DNA polymerase